MKKLALKSKAVCLRSHGLSPQHMRTPGQALPPMRGKSLNPFHALGRPSLNHTWRPGVSGIPLIFPAPRDQRSCQFLWFSRSLGSRGGRKLVVLTHRTRESSPGNSTHFVSMVLGYVAPLPLRGSLTRLGVCGGVGHRQTCLLSPQPNPISPIDFQAHNKHSYPLVTASPEWRLS